MIIGYLNFFLCHCFNILTNINLSIVCKKNMFYTCKHVYLFLQVSGCPERSHTKNWLSNIVMPLEIVLKMYMFFLHCIPCYKWDYPNIKVLFHFILSFFTSLQQSFSQNLSKIITTYMCMFVLENVLTWLWHYSFYFLVLYQV